MNLPLTHKSSQPKRVAASRGLRTLIMLEGSTKKKKTVFHLRWLVTMRTRIHAHIQKCVRLIQLSAIFVFKDSDKDKSKLKTKMPHYPTFRHSLSFLAQFLLMQSLSAAPPHSHNYFNKLFDWIFKMLIFHITASKLSDRVQPQACWVKWSRKW